MRVLTVLPGPDTHGVVRHGLAVADLVARRGARVTLARSLEPVTGAHDLTHVHFTDALFGQDVDLAASAFAGWARTAPQPLVVTLHDVPGVDPDPARDARRRAGYRRVLGCADAVVVSAEREVADAVVPGLAPVVVPLPVEPLAGPGPVPAWADRPSVAVLGFVYPGKGHERALQAVARGADRGARVVVLGGVSPGHDVLLADLRRRAGALGVELLVTGPLREPDLHAAVRAATVPLAAYRTLGASGSLSTWLAGGRRPVVLTGSYPRELQERWPGSLLLHDDDALDAAVGRALAQPARTWAERPPPRPDVGAAHLAVYRAAVSRAAVSRAAVSRAAVSRAAVSRAAREGTCAPA